MWQSARIAATVRAWRPCSRSSARRRSTRGSFSATSRDTERQRNDAMEANLWFQKEAFGTEQLPLYVILEPLPGGRFAVDINGVPFRGEYLEVDPPHRVVVSWGMAGSADLPPGSSRVEFTLTPTPTGTALSLNHTGLPETRAQTHGIGWRHYLGRLHISAAGGDPGGARHIGSGPFRFALAVSRPGVTDARCCRLT